MRNTKAYKIYIIEKRDENGALLLNAPQPEDFFGMKAIAGITENEIAQIVFQRAGPDVVLDGRTMLRWPAKLNPQFIAREKTWGDIS